MENYKEPAQLKISTINFSKIDESDIKGIVEELISKGNHIVSVQGIDIAVADIIYRTFKSNGYCFVRFDKVSALQSRDQYETIFSKIPILKKELYVFKKGIGRGLSRYLVKVGHDKENPRLLWVSTSELDDNNVNRKAQIIEIDNELRVTLGSKDNRTYDDEKIYGIVFAGDTNIPVWQTDLGAPEGWLDAWREKGTSQNEFAGGKDRYDRIWWTSYEDDRLRCVSFELACDFGVEAVFDIL